MILIQLLLAVSGKYFHHKKAAKDFQDRFGPGQAKAWSVGISHRSDDHDTSDIGHLNTEDRLHYMANITIRDVKEWGGNIFEVHINGSYTERKIAASNHAGLGEAQT